LFRLFWDNYLEKTADEEMLTVVQPFYVWRGLVVASPMGYPQLSLDVCKKLFTLIKNVLETEKLDLNDINSYIEKGVGV